MAAGSYEESGVKGGSGYGAAGAGAAGAAAGDLVQVKPQRVKLALRMSEYELH